MAETTETLFGDIQSDVFSALKLPEDSDSNFHYIFSFIEQKGDDEDNGYLTIRNIYFNSDSSYFYNSQLIEKIDASKTNIVSSFFTENKKFVTFFHRDSKYKIIVFDESLNKRVESDIYDVHEEKEDEDLNIFFKCIHFKGEIGAFIYFKTNNDSNPYFTLKEVNSHNNKVEKYFNDDTTYTIDGDFYKNSKMNDLKKMNNYQICYVSTNEAKKKINIIIFNLYFEKTDMLIRYYSIEINDQNIIMLFNELTSGIYNNFITIAFSHCPQEPCYEPSHTHYTSIIIFNYPNSNDTTIDFVEQLYITDKNIQDDFFFDFINTLKIENNIFGYEYKGVSISNIPNEIYLKVDGNIINNKNILILKDQSISFSFHPNNVYSAENYSIEFAFALTEPGYEELNSYCTKVESLMGLSISSGDTYSNVEYEKNDYIGKTSSFIISIKNELMTKCEDSFCSLCYSDNSRCITCKYNATFNEIGEKNCFRIYSPLTTILIPETTVQTTILIPETSYPILPITESMKLSTEEESIYIPPEIIASTPLIYEQKIEKTIPISTITKQFDIEKTIPISTIAKQYDTEKTTVSTLPEAKITEIDNDEIIEGNYKGKLTSEQISKLYNNLKESINSNTSKLIEAGNVIIQISTLEDQKNNDNPNVSSIDIGECEDIIKEKEGLTDEDNLIILKMDLKNEDSSSTYVQYEVYNPKTSKMISLDICEGVPISISVPIKLEENTQSLYNSLSDSGYNLFNLSDSFYNDICSTYTTENGTDLTLADRKNIIYDSSGNVSMCQENCNFQYYNITTKKAKCDCSVQTESTITDTSKINFNKDNFADSFYKTLKNSNFLVLKCYKLVFSAKGQTNNKGSYAMSAITFLFIILMFVFIFNAHKKINYYIEIILKQKLFESENSKKKKPKEKSKDKNIRSKDKKTNSYKKSQKKKKKEESKNKDKKKGIKEKDKKKKNKNYPPKKNIPTKKNSQKFQNSSDSLSISDRKIKPNSFTHNVNIIFKNQNFLLTSKKKNKEIIYRRNIKEKTTNKLDSKKTLDLSDKCKEKALNDDELNDLDYKKAIELDKRTYFQYYFSLLKKKHLILFAFIPTNDYNITAIKISLLLLSFSLFFTINGFFFSDATMNKINEDKGEFNIIFQIPQILYSTVISAMINMLLKRLSLSQEQFLSIKREKDYKTAETISKKKKIV